MGIRLGLRQGHGQKPTTGSGQGMGDVVPLLGGRSSRGRALGPLLLNCGGRCWRHCRPVKKWGLALTSCGEMGLYDVSRERDQIGLLDCGGDGRSGGEEG